MSTINVALIGNPNTGKTSLFNQLTGLNQKVGNYPGVTVDKKQGSCKLANNQTALITDLPGTYSINPTSIDESIVLKTLLDSKAKPDVIVLVADVENLKRNLLLFTQIQDLEIPTILALNMADQLERKGITIDVAALAKEMQTNVVLLSARNNQGITELKEEITKYKSQKSITNFNELAQKIDATYFDQLAKISANFSVYELWMMLTKKHFSLLSDAEKTQLELFESDVLKEKKYQHKETIYRYQKINSILKETYTVDTSKATDLRSKLDRVFTHKIFGYFIFFGLLLLIFQSVFDWASMPMDFIDDLFANIAEFTKMNLSSGKLTDLLTEGIIPGIGGVVIFIPQIAILFLFIAILEETGYMSRVVFLMDKIMRRFGMSGKSVIPLISGTACAIPAIMATRTISSWKERLITILVTPFTTCSARLPVYAILIALIIMSLAGAGIDKIILAITIVSWVYYARTARGVVLAEKEKAFSVIMGLLHVGALTSKGIKYKHLEYDSVALEQYRKQYPQTKQSRRKKIKIDPDDLSTIYVYLEELSGYIEVPSKNSDGYTDNLSLCEHQRLVKTHRDYIKGEINALSLAKARMALHARIKSEQANLREMSLPERTRKASGTKKTAELTGVNSDSSSNKSNIPTLVTHEEESNANKVEPIDDFRARWNRRKKERSS